MEGPIWGRHLEYVHKKKKYLGNKDFAFWYIKGTIGSIQGSAIWQSFRKIQSFFLQNLSWSFQNGNKIFIGLDPIFGAGKDWSIPQEIINVFQRAGIFVWGQVIASWQGPFPIWKEAQVMGLQGQLALQWNKILTIKKNIGICRIEPHDYLTWKRKRRTDSISVDDTYLTISNIQLPQTNRQFPTVLWKIGVPSKIMIFSWLVFHNKNLIWENLQKR